MNKTLWGTDGNGNDIYTYEIAGKGGMKVKVMDFGATVLEIHVPDKNGNDVDVALGYEKLEDYFTNDPYFGCCVVPSANRIGGAKFTLNGKEYSLDVNDGENNLHSGFDSICHKMWQVTDEKDDSITFVYDKKDMELKFLEMYIWRLHIQYLMTMNLELIMWQRVMRIQYSILQITATSIWADMIAVMQWINWYGSIPRNLQRQILIQFQMVSLWKWQAHRWISQQRRLWLRILKLISIS